MAGVPISGVDIPLTGWITGAMGCRAATGAIARGKTDGFGDLADAVKYIKGAWFFAGRCPGAQFGVARLRSVQRIRFPGDIAGLVLLSGAYEGRKGVSKPLSFSPASAARLMRGLCDLLTGPLSMPMGGE